MIEKKINRLLLFVFLFLLVSNIFFILWSKHLLDKTNKIELTNFVDDNNNSIDYKVLNNKNKNIFKYKINITIKEFEKISGDIYKLIIYRLSGHWYKIFVNNICIGTAGNLKNDSSIIWNSINYFDIDKNILKENNTIEIELFATYEVGKLSFYPFITDVESATKLITWFNFILINLYIFAIGVLWFSFLILFVLSYFLKRVKKAYFFYAFASFISSFYIFDNLLILNIIIQTITFKKIIFFCLYFSVILISFGLYLQFNTKVNLYSGILFCGLLFYFIIISNDLIILKKLSSFVNLFILINICFWILTTIKYYNKSNEAKILLYASIYTFIVAIYDIFYNLFGKGSNYNIISTNIYSANVISISIISMVIFDFINLHKNISNEKEKAKFFFYKSIIDQMTGIYNHQYIISSLEYLNPPFSVIMFDVDYFKQINDKYGHHIGDFVIKFVAKDTKKCVRYSDLVGRYGGDEFFVILVNCLESDAFEIASKIRNELKKKHITSDGLELNITISMGIYTCYNKELVKDILKKVDEALYLSKRNGRDQINIYKEI